MSEPDLGSIMFAARAKELTQTGAVRVRTGRILTVFSVTVGGLGSVRARLPGLSGVSATSMAHIGVW
jgi:hypothetical protein